MFTVPECRSFIVGITAGLLGLVGNVPTASAATCLGAPVDGVIFDATIYNLRGRQLLLRACRLQRRRCDHFVRQWSERRLTLDEDDFDAAETISAYDYERRSYWDIELDSQRCRP